MSAWSCRSIDGKADQKIVPPRLRIPYWKGLGADSEEKHEHMSDIDTVVVDILKALVPKRPIRESDIQRPLRHVRFVPLSDSCTAAGRIIRRQLCCRSHEAALFCLSASDATQASDD